MVVTLIRTVIFYLVVILSLRIMGKRQIGELQPGELVITILISECAAAPIQDLDRPVISGIIAIFTLVILEILLSFLTLKLPFLRKIIDGQPAIIIRDGVIQQATMKKLRLSVEDLSNNLRQMGYFDLTDLAYCIVETDGHLSVLPKAGKAPATAEQVSDSPADDGIACVIVGDGRVHQTALSLCGMDRAALDRILKKERVAVDDIFILTADAAGHYSLIKKENPT